MIHDTQTALTLQKQLIQELLDEALLHAQHAPGEGAAARRRAASLVTRIEKLGFSAEHILAVSPLRAEFFYEPNGGESVTFECHAFGDVTHAVVHTLVLTNGVVIQGDTSDVAKTAA